MPDLNYDEVEGYYARIEKTIMVEKIVGDNSGDVDNTEEDDEEEDEN